MKSIRKKEPWRWDVIYNATTDPEYPGVETGRQAIGRQCGYTRFRFQAVSKIVNNILDNPYKKVYTER